MPLEDWDLMLVYIWIKWLNRLYTLLHCTGAFKQPLILWKSEVCHPEGSTKGWDLALDGGDCCLTCSICSWQGHCHDSWEAPREKDVGWVASLGKAGQTMEAPFSSIYSNFCTVPSKMNPLIGWVSERTLLDLTLGVLPSARRGCPTLCIPISCATGNRPMRTFKLSFANSTYICKLLFYCSCHIWTIWCCFNDSPCWSGRIHSTWFDSVLDFISTETCGDLVGSLGTGRVCRFANFAHQISSISMASFDPQGLWQILGEPAVDWFGSTWQRYQLCPYRWMVHGTQSCRNG